MDIISNQLHRKYNEKLENRTNKRLTMPSKIQNIFSLHANFSHQRWSAFTEVSGILQSIQADSQQCCNLYGLESSSDFQFFPYFFLSLWRLFQAKLLQLISATPSYSRVFVEFTLANTRE